MTRAELIALAERVEGLAGPCRETDAEIAEAVGEEHGRKSGWCNSDNGDYYVIEECARPYTASLDAAMTLVPEGHFWLRLSELTMTVSRPDPNEKRWAKHFEAAGATPALALVAASLRAHAERIGDG